MPHDANGKWIPPAPVDPVRVERGGEVEETHPSYGCVTLVRRTGGCHLFDSKAFHTTSVVMEVHEASVSDHGTYRFIHPRKPLVEIAMTAEQWARLVSSFSVGAGVPCTLLRVGAESKPPIPEPVSVRDQYVDEVRKTARAAAAKANTARAALAKMRDEKKISAKAAEELGNLISNVVRTVTEGLPFCVDLAVETIEKEAERAKAEAEALIGFRLLDLGLQTRREQLALLERQALASHTPSELPDAAFAEEPKP